MTPGPNNITHLIQDLILVIKNIPLNTCCYFWLDFILIIMNTGLIFIFKKYPIIQEIIRILGSIFLVYLAYLISFSETLKKENNKNPITFGKAFILQFINPKSLVVSMTTVSIFIDPINYLRDSIIVISYFFFYAVISINSWCLMGMYLRNFATSEKFIRNFNYIMSFLLIVCVIMFYV